jgi:type VI secretion system secreted protein VgrG
MNLDKYLEFVARWEGKYGKSLEDSASKYFCPTPYKGVKYHTSHGITYQTWVNSFGTDNDAEFYSMPSEMWFKIFKTRFWDKVKGDRLPFNIAVLTTEFAWMSGVGVGARSLQTALRKLGQNIEIDGQIGNQTINAVKNVDSKLLFDEMIKIRRAFYEKIAVGKNAKWKKGWLNRLEAVKVFR